MFDYQSFGPSEDFTEHHLYRFRQRHTNTVTLVVKREGTMYALGFGNGRKVRTSCDQWDRLYRPTRENGS